MARPGLPVEKVLEMHPLIVADANELKRLVRQLQRPLEHRINRRVSHGKDRGLQPAFHLKRRTVLLPRMVDDCIELLEHLPIPTPTAPLIPSIGFLLGMLTGGTGPDDQDAGAPEFKKLRAAEAGHPIEATGKELRKMFSWLKSADDDYVEGTAAR